MPQCTANCECVCVSLHTVQVHVCASVCVFDLWFPNQTLFCGFFFFSHHQSKRFHKSLAFTLHVGRFKRIPQSQGCRDTIAIKRQASAKETEMTQVVPELPL